MTVRPNQRSNLLNDSSIYSDSQSQYSSSFDSASTTATEPEDTMSHPLIPGVYVPTLCFFKANTEDLDLPAIASHATRLAKAGVAGIATQGSNGEAVHLSHSERQLVTSTTRKALRDAGYSKMPIIVGCGAQSVRETIQYCREASHSGGDYALILPPSYYAPLFAPNSETVIKFFTDVADGSPIPLIIYNYPGAVSGLDLDSDTIIQLSKHPKIVGVKLTCGNTGKLARIAAATSTKPSSAPSASENEQPASPPFLILGGSADFILPTLISGGHGVLAGLANIAPKACIQTVALYTIGATEQAQELQAIIARGDWAAIKGGIVGTKAGLQGAFGYGGFARSPMPKPDEMEMWMWVEEFGEVVGMEKSI